MNADHDASSVPWWHQEASAEAQDLDYLPRHAARPSADGTVDDSTGDSGDDAGAEPNDTTGYAAEELVRLVAALREWVAIGGGARARTTWDAATRAVGGSIRPEVVEHLQAAALELAAALQAALAPAHHDDARHAASGEADPATVADWDGDDEDLRDSARRVQRIDLD